MGFVKGHRSALCRNSLDVEVAAADALSIFLILGFYDLDHLCHRADLVS